METDAVGAVITGGPPTCLVCGDPDGHWAGRVMEWIGALTTVRINDKHKNELHNKIAYEYQMVQVNFQMKEERLALIDRAAAIQGITRAEFVLRSSEAAAIETLIERPVIALEDKAYDAFIAALDAPVESNVHLKKRFARQPLWER